MSNKPDYTPEEVKQLVVEFEEAYGFPPEVTRQGLKTEGKPPSFKEHIESVSAERELREQTAAAGISKERCG